MNEIYEGRIDAAFKELESKGYFARRKFWCCQSCACAAIPDENQDKYVYYHEQDADNLEKRGECHLGFSGDGSEIVRVLNDNDIPTVWDGSDNTRIKMVCR